MLMIIEYQTGMHDHEQIEIAKESVAEHMHICSAGRVNATNREHAVPIDNCLKRLKDRLNPRIYFPFGHSDIGPLPKGGRVPVKDSIYTVY